MQLSQLTQSLPPSFQHWILLPGYTSTAVFQSLIKLRKGKKFFFELAPVRLIPPDRQKAESQKNTWFSILRAGDSLTLHVSLPQPLLVGNSKSFKMKAIPYCTCCEDCLWGQKTLLLFPTAFISHHPFITLENKYQSLTFKLRHRIIEYHAGGAQRIIWSSLSSAKVILYNNRSFFIITDSLSSTSLPSSVSSVPTWNIHLIQGSAAIRTSNTQALL